MTVGMSNHDDQPRTDIGRFDNKTGTDPDIELVGHRSDVFYPAELNRIRKAAGIDDATIHQFAAEGMRNPDAIIAWAAAGHTPPQAGSFVSEGAPGPTDLSTKERAPHRRPISRLSDMRGYDSPTDPPQWPGPHGEASVVPGRKWDGTHVAIDAHIANGLPGFNVVGMPGEQQRTTRDRIRAAILTSGYRWPGGRITLTLSDTADSRTDLAFAVAVLQASGQTSPAEPGTEFWGELGLDGHIRDVAG